VTNTIESAKSADPFNEVDHNPNSLESGVRKVTVVIPFFNEQQGIKALAARLRSALDDEKFIFELVAVDDGSSDATLEELRSWQRRDHRLVIVKLSRNWGHQAAFNAGLDVARGDAVIFMDGDLEDPPELIQQLLDAWEDGYDTVYTRKTSRHQKGLKRFLTWLYYRLISKMTRYGVQPQSGMFSLVDAKVAKVLRQMKELNKSYPNLRSFAGFKQKEVCYTREPRAHGSPKQSLSRLIMDGLNALFANTFIPIRIFLVIGLFFSMFFTVVGLLVLFVKVSGIEFWIFHDVPGTQLILLAVLTFGSLQIMFLGILGEYIARIYDESKGRPYYVIDKIERVIDDSQLKVDGV
jgi:polyisoprenyl-phosphate glycosyltransferase